MELAWIYLAIAVVLEIVWALTLKSTEGFTRLWSSVVNVTTLLVYLYFLSTALKVLPVAIAYPLWAGLRSVGVAVIASVFFKEKLGIIQILCILMVIFGAVGLKVSEIQ